MSGAAFFVCGDVSALRSRNEISVFDSNRPRTDRSGELRVSLKAFASNLIPSMFFRAVDLQDVRSNL